MIRIKKLNESFLRIFGDVEELINIRNQFSFWVPGYNFHPKYQAGIWDGKIYLFRGHKLPLGLFNKLVEYLNDKKIEYKLENFNRRFSKIKKTKLESALKYSRLPEKYQERYYQKDAFIEALLNERGIIVSPTASGKSLIIYLIILYLLANKFINEKVLLVVPTTHLVYQMQKDFIEYSEKHGNIEKKIHIIMGGKEKDSEKKQIYISTWQSIYNQKIEYFKKFGCVIVDEVHHAKAQSITKIMERSVNAFYRLGFTGTLDEWRTHHMMIEGLFGPIKKIVGTKNLIDEGFLSRLNIYNIIIKYSDVERNMAGSFSYHDETRFIINHKDRNRKVVDIINKLDGNILILFLRIKHGGLLYELIHKRLDVTKKRILYIDGSTPAEEREWVRDHMEKYNNCILLATYGTYSTGVNITNLHNIILASPTKSKIRVLQSIGRGLRLHDKKEKLRVIDVVDNLTFDKKENFSMRHFKKRLSLYKEENFKFADKHIYLR